MIMRDLLVGPSARVAPGWVMTEMSRAALDGRAPHGFGRGQIIRRIENGAYVAGSEPRSDGCAAGW